MMWTFALFSAHVDGIPIHVRSVDGEVVILCGDRAVDSLEALVHAVPGLRREEHLIAYCRLANYLNTSTMFRMIMEPESYRREYDALHDHDDSPATVTRNYGPFDLTELAEPALVDGVPVFYAESAAGRVPYQVLAPYPNAGETSVMSYEPLAYAGDDEDEDEHEDEEVGGDHA
ncbi:hypothetical protein SCOR_01025 [Sulfidibacter corallicola]|uniref:Uncharacterized protein n=1 Tax=Sulfidibacter corallicola TaxID=2818388 RepID=A0A8A4TFM7_SULCO|nr:hypothetical protein [Sulfidibacter corallicola]QTD48889.1 hypothetical protein J3U87_25175 [Sulfidibacter corallicola]